MGYLVYLGLPPQMALDLQLRTGLMYALLRTLVVNQALEQRRQYEARRETFFEHLKRGRCYEVA